MLTGLKSALQNGLRLRAFDELSVDYGLGEEMVTQLNFMPKCFSLS